MGASKGQRNGPGMQHQPAAGMSILHRLAQQLVCQNQHRHADAHQPSTMFLMPANLSRPVGPGCTATSVMTRLTSSGGISSLPFLLLAAGATCITPERRCQPLQWHGLAKSIREILRPLQLWRAKKIHQSDEHKSKSLNGGCALAHCRGMGGRFAGSMAP